jgi:hypothetical protein
MSKTWFITGASSGFGRELTQLLLKRGDRVAATVRRPDALRDPAGEYGDRLWVGILDVTDGMAVRNVVDRAFAELKRINVVVSNAGYALSARPRRSRMPRSSARSTQTCSVRSMWPAPQFPIYATRAAAASSRSRPRPARGPIPQWASMPRPNGVLRASSKARSRRSPLSALRCPWSNPAPRGRTSRAPVQTAARFSTSTTRHRSVTSAASWRPCHVSGRPAQGGIGDHRFGRSEPGAEAAHAR